MKSKGGGRKREREREREGEGDIGRKFSSGAFICSFNEMRMHYTWIAGDINFLAWTCSGPWRAAGWSVVRERPEGARRFHGRGKRVAKREGVCVYEHRTERVRRRKEEKEKEEEKEKAWRERERKSLRCTRSTTTRAAHLFPSFPSIFFPPSSAVILTSGRRGASGETKRKKRKKKREARTRPDGRVGRAEFACRKTRQEFSLRDGWREGGRRGWIRG